MSTARTEPAPLSPSAYLAGEVRVELARRGLSLAKFSALLGRSTFWTQRRLGPSRNIDVTLEEATEVAAALGLELVDLIDSPRVLNPL